MLLPVRSVLFSSAVFFLLPCGPVKAATPWERAAELGDQQTAAASARDELLARPDNVSARRFLARHSILYPETRERLSGLEFDLPQGAILDDRLTFQSGVQAKARFDTTKVSEAEAFVQVQALSRLGDEGIAAIRSLLGDPEPKVRRWMAGTLNRLEIPGRTEMLLEAFAAEEQAQGEALDSLIKALSLTASEEVFRRLEQARERLLQSGKADERTKDLEKVYRSALLRLPNLASTEELLQAVRGEDDPWRQELAAAELVRRGGDREDGRLRLLEDALRPGTFPESVWMTLTTAEFSDPRQIEAIRQALRSGNPRLEARGLALAERIPYRLRGVLVPEMISLIEKESPEMLTVRKAADLLAVPHSPEDVKRVTRLLFSWRPAEITIRPGWRSRGQDIRAELAGSLQSLTTETLQAAFIEVHDEFTTPGAGMESVIETLKYAQEVVLNWPSETGRTAVVEAVSKLEERGRPIPVAAAGQLRRFRITPEQLARILRWKPAGVVGGAGEEDARLAALASLRSRCLNAEELALVRPLLRSESPADLYLAFYLLQPTAEQCPAAITEADEEAFSAALEKLRTEHVRLEGEGDRRKVAPVADAIKIGTDALNSLRGKGRARNWFLR